MAKIKVNELKNTIKELKSKQEDLKVLDFFGIQIEVKQYLPILEKITFADSVYKSAVDTKDELHIVRKNALDIAFKIFLIETYTNISLPQKKDEDGKMVTDTIQSYDMLVSSDLYDIVYDAIPEDEILDLNMVLGNHVRSKQDEYDQRNTIQYIIKDTLEKLINKIPDEAGLNELVKNVSEEFSNFDPQKLEFLKSAMDWDNGVER